MAFPRLFIAADLGVIEALASNGRVLCFRYAGIYNELVASALNG
jgi:hypothetical protein